MRVAPVEEPQPNQPLLCFGLFWWNSAAALGQSVKTLLLTSVCRIGTAAVPQESQGPMIIMHNNK